MKIYKNTAKKMPAGDVAGRARMRFLDAGKIRCLSEHVRRPGVLTKGSNGNAKRPVASA
jgi:hypothetical protein